MRASYMRVMDTLRLLKEMGVLGILLGAFTIIWLVVIDYGLRVIIQLKGVF